MNIETMMAVFDNPGARDGAVLAAKESPGVEVMWIGDTKPVSGGSPCDVAPRPFVLFRSNMIGGLHFMQHGASSCGPV